MVWDYETGMLLHALEGHKDSVNVLEFDPEGRYLVSGSSTYDMNECAINVWDLKNGQLKIQKSHGSYQELNHLAISNDGVFVLSASRDKKVIVWMEFIEYIEFQERISNNKLS